MNETLVIELETKHSAGVYQRMPIVVEKGRGATVWDVNGKEYVDCAGGYGVALVGHCNPVVVAAVERQLQKIITCHGSLYNPARAELLEKLARAAPEGLDTIFLSNSGAEANECAIKLARRYTGRKEIISFVGSYHGKTSGAVSVTWGRKYREPFEPLVPGVKFARFGDVQSVKDSLTTDTAALIVEPVQGESGVHPPPPGFLREIREICNEKDVLLIFDEIQTGLGRTGRMRAGEHWNVTPDIMTVAKGLAGGVPIGATFSRREVMSALKLGEHSSTFGGNPLACAAASATIDYITESNLPGEAERKGAILKAGLERVGKSNSTVREVRGLGLMIGMEVSFEVRDLLHRCLKDGLVLLYSGKSVVRFLPPLVIQEEQIQRTLSILDASLSERISKHEGHISLRQPF